ncbi:UcrQ-domain-containing protein [Piedraia hortae CBS 480.64]|uniref:Cytochrome b-c1 complex subunit 8 n=1 Tax=Piedraia hortae CBS 480.64 TaxID=1314780 RepID=A0A6A7BSC9_9PEZI|nr:UcrQ-domain-containing protein [Piedraia hortae CBS 480.64]
MRPSQILRGGGGEKRPGQYLGPWGAFGSLPQKGVTSYAVANDRLNPLAGTLRAAIFNTFYRTRMQILYWSIPMFLAYEALQWAEERNKYLNSKAGRAEFADEEE